MTTRISSKCKIPLHTNQRIVEKLQCRSDMDNLWCNCLLIHLYIFSFETLCSSMIKCQFYILIEEIESLRLN